MPGRYVDAPTDAVVVLARDTAAAKAFVRDGGLSGTDVRIERSTERPRPLANRYPDTVSVAGSTDAPVGASVCRSASTAGRRCGTTQQKNASVTYPEGTITGLTRTNACAEPGDPGGSWLTGGQAQGVTSGGLGNRTSSGTICFQPVDEILQVHGPRLVASGTTPPTSTTPPTTADPGRTTWQPGVAYATGSLVAHGGVGHRCLQGHTSQPGWGPPAVPALWQRV